MGAWGTGVFENDTALDTIAEMSELIEHYYKGLLDSEDEHNIMLAAFLYIATKDKDKAIEQFADPDATLLNEIECVVRMLNNVEQYKYKLIGNLYKCIDKVNDWTDDCKASRKATVQKMIDLIAKED
jgi:hypothetical protein